MNDDHTNNGHQVDLGGETVGDGLGRMINTREDGERKLLVVCPLCGKDWRADYLAGRHDHDDVKAHLRGHDHERFFETRSVDSVSEPRGDGQQRLVPDGGHTATRKHFYLITEHKHDDRVGCVSVSDTRRTRPTKNEEGPITVLDEECKDFRDVGKQVGLGYHDFADPSEYEDNDLVADIMQAKIRSVDRKWAEKAGVEHVYENEDEVATDGGQPRDFPRDGERIGEQWPTHPQRGHTRRTRRLTRHEDWQAGVLVGLACAALIGLLWRLLR